VDLTDAHARVIARLPPGNRQAGLIAPVPVGDRQSGSTGSGRIDNRQSRFALRPSRPTALLPLYASFIGLQVADIGTTLHALGNGAVEANPALGGIAGNPAALVATKAGMTAATLYLNERLWKKHRVAALALMIALNAGYAAIVAHNASVIARQ